MSAWFLPAWTLWRREVVRFLRQPNRVMGAVGSPLLFWLLIGSGVGRSFRPESGDENYMAYVFPGTLVLILLFTAIFSTISIIEDRREGFLQSVLVAPVSRAMIVLGKIFGGATLAAGQALLFLALAPTVGLSLSVGSTLAAAGLLSLLAVALTGLGFVIAWRMQSIQGFHAVMNFLLLPMWLLSGALFPPDGAATWMQWLIKLNPLTYGIAAMRRLLSPEVAGGPPMALCLVITVLFAAVMFAAAAAVARGHTAGDLQ